MTEGHEESPEQPDFVFDIVTVGPGDPSYEYEDGELAKFASRKDKDGDWIWKTALVIERSEPWQPDRKVLAGIGIADVSIKHSYVGHCWRVLCDEEIHDEIPGSLLVPIDQEIVTSDGTAGDTELSVSKAEGAG